MNIDLPDNAGQCGPNRREIRVALQGVLARSKARVVGEIRAADGTLKLKVSVSENCTKTADLSVLTSVTIIKTGADISNLPIWDSGIISFGQGTKVNGPGAIRYLGQKFLAAWDAANQ